MLDETLGQRLRRLRLAAELTQTELAQRADTAQNHVSDVESDKKTPGIDLCRRLAAACGVGLSDLLGD